MISLSKHEGVWDRAYVEDLEAAVAEKRGSNVWILSEGERYEGERVLAVYGTYDAAIKALTAIGNHSGNEDMVMRQDGDVMILEDYVFYSIIRPQEVVS